MTTRISLRHNHPVTICLLLLILFAGGVLLVARKGRTVFHQAFGYRDRETGDTIQRDDLFRIASQTKAIVSAAIMMLQEQGQLLLNDPLHRYLPEFSDTTVAVSDGDEGYSVAAARRDPGFRAGTGAGVSGHHRQQYHPR